MTYISITILTNIFLLLSFNKIKKLIPLNDKPDKMRVSFLDNIRVFNNLSQPVSVNNVKGKANMKLLLSPSKIWVNKNKFFIFGKSIS